MQGAERMDKIDRIERIILCLSPEHPVDPDESTPIGNSHWPAMPAIKHSASRPCREPFGAPEQSLARGCRSPRAG